MGQGSYVICEWDSVQKAFPRFQEAVANLEGRMIQKCTADWSPKSMGNMVPSANQYGRTTIMPQLFRGQSTAILQTWRQNILAAGNQTIIYGNGTGMVIPEDFKVAWLGLALPNLDQQVTELKYQIGDTKYGRIDVEALRRFNKPAIVFEEGYILNEEESFDVQAYVENAGWQRIVMLGATYFKIVDRVLGNTGATIT